MRKREIKQGDIYICNLSLDGQDSEQSGIRPCLIISANILNINRDNVIIVPITSVINKRTRMINHYALLKEYYDFFTCDENIALLECVRDISKNRLERKIGSISQDDIDQIIDLIVYDFKEFLY